MFLVLLFLCAGLSGLLIWPLWTLATNFQEAYTLSISIIIGLSLLFLILRQVKKHGAKNSLRFIIKLIILLAGISFPFTLVIHGKRLYALAAIIFFSLLFFLASKILKSKTTELKTGK